MFTGQVEAETEASKWELHYREALRHAAYVEALPIERRLPWGAYGLWLSFTEFRKSLRSRRGGGRPKTTARLYPFQIRVLEMARRLMRLNRSKFAAKIGVSGAAYSRLTHRDRRQRMGVPDPGMLLMRLAAPLVGGPSSPILQHRQYWNPDPAWMAKWWLLIKPIELEKGEDGRSHGGPNGGGCMLSSPGQLWVPEQPLEVATKEDRAALLFEPRGKYLQQQFTQAVRLLAWGGRGRYWLDQSDDPRGGYREHVDLPSIGHVSWNPKWPNMPVCRVELYPEALHNGAALWFMRTYVQPIASYFTFKVGRRDTAHDVITTRPLDRFVVVWNSAAPTWAAYAPMCPQLAPDVLNMRIGSISSEAFHRSYNKACEAIDRGVCCIDPRCTCAALKGGEQCPVCRHLPGNRHVLRLEVVEQPTGVSRHPSDYALRAPNPSAHVRLIDIRTAAGEPYALFLLVACRLYGTWAVRRMLREVCTSRTTWRSIGWQFDQMLNYYANKTELPQPADLYERARPDWHQLLHDLCG